MADQEMLLQTAPFPSALQELIDNLKYKPGWVFDLLPDLDRGPQSRGLTLRIKTTCPDAYAENRIRTIDHFMIVPAAPYDERAWQRWLFNQILLVEQHEAGEFFEINGEKPYMPLHHTGADPYVVVELMSEAERDPNFMRRQR